MKRTSMETELEEEVKPMAPSEAEAAESEDDALHRETLEARMGEESALEGAMEGELEVPYRILCEVALCGSVFCVVIILF
jgi:hypothetical protein